MTRLSRTLIPAALGAAFALTAASGAVQARVPYNQYYQFQQAMLPTDTPNEYRLGIWIFSPANGRIRLCVLNEDAEATAPVMKCSAWTGSGPAGQYYLMQIRRHPSQPGRYRAGLWILNRETGHARACVITDMKDPTGTLHCSKVE
jgi:hypothetical protein